MKIRKIKTLVSVLALAAGIIMFNPSSASAAWKHDGYGWWNTEGSYYSIGWRNIDNNWYYFDSNGYMKTGWAHVNGTWYYLNESGSMKTGWLNSNNSWYYLDNSGAMKTGWINSNGTWYYTNQSGAMHTGLLTLGNNTYYLNESGAMATGDVTLNGVKYTFASSGEKISSTPVSDNSNTTGNNENIADTSDKVSSGGGGGSSSPSDNDNSTKFAGYSDLYGTWTIESYIKDSGIKTSLSDSEIKFVVGLDFIVSKDKIYYDSLINAANPDVEEFELNNIEFNRKFGTSLSKLGIYGDTVNCIRVSAKDSSNNTKTGYIITDKNDNVYAIVKGAAFRLERA
ncbi:MAG: N-acetylmuramoyl-L-alanine amidase family protein [Clostridium sp.]|nr:N-acetylmuramoyl-L-alanine amidase family protein [Clostridium sp.]